MADFAASEFGDTTTPNSKRARRGSDAKLVDSISTAIEREDERRHKELLEYIHKEVSANAPLAVAVANMLRNGTLQRAASKQRASEAEGLQFGKELPPSLKLYKALRDGNCRTILKTFEPAVFTDDVFDDDEGPSLADMRLMITFSLGLVAGARLPQTFPSLRFDKALAEFLKVRYTEMGNRLAGYTPGAGFGYLVVRGNTISTLCPKTGGGHIAVQMSELGEPGHDWELIDNCSLCVKLSSKAKGDKINPLSRLTRQNEGNELFPEEATYFEVNVATLPEWITQPLPAALRPHTGSGAESGDANASSPEAPAKGRAKGRSSMAPPQGTGSVAARPPRS